MRHLFSQEEEVMMCLHYQFLSPRDVCNNITSDLLPLLPVRKQIFVFHFFNELNQHCRSCKCSALRVLKSTDWERWLACQSVCPGEHEAGGLSQCRIKLCRGGLQHPCLSANLWARPRAGWVGRDCLTRPQHWAQSISNSLWINKYRT